jgi:hypothetical protein
MSIGHPALFGRAESQILSLRLDLVSQLALISILDDSDMRYTK